jgi:hypothetical protein
LYQKQISVKMCILQYINRIFSFFFFSFFLWIMLRFCCDIISFQFIILSWICCLAVKLYRVTGKIISFCCSVSALIAEVVLYSEGFESSKLLASKMTQMYKFCSEQLSQQDHYDFGMRLVLLSFWFKWYIQLLK